MCVDFIEFGINRYHKFLDNGQTVVARQIHNLHYVRFAPERRNRRKKKIKNTPLFSSNSFPRVLTNNHHGTAKLVRFHRCGGDFTD
jgi:hypothetical protein